MNLADNVFIKFISNKNIHKNCKDFNSDEARWKIIKY